MDSGEDTEIVEETLMETKELQGKLDSSVQQLLDISPSEDADTLCSQLKNSCTPQARERNSKCKTKQCFISQFEGNI